MNQSALQLLNQHLDDIVVLGGKQYPREKVARVYAKLNSEPPTEFYSGERAKGNISNNEVSFKTYYPETGWNYQSPAELGLETQSPRPTKELIQMSRAFQNLTNSPQGRAIYFNEPISQHRADAYENLGFNKPSPDSKYQVLDNRRFTNSPTIAELLLTGDTITYELDKQKAIEANLRRKHVNLPDRSAINRNIFYDIDDNFYDDPMPYEPDGYRPSMAELGYE